MLSTVQDFFKKHFLKIILFLFALALLFQWYIPFEMVQNHEAVLKEGRSYKFLTAPVDPHDFYRGKYVSLSFAVEDKKYPFSDEKLRREFPQYKNTNTENLPYHFKGYAKLKEDSNGFATIEEISLLPPVKDDENAWLAVDLRSHLFAQPSFVDVTLPFDRFYLNEKLAPMAEKLYQEGTRSNKDTKVSTYVTAKVYKQKAVLENLFLLGEDFETWAKKVLAAEKSGEEK